MKKKKLGLGFQKVPQIGKKGHMAIYQVKACANYTYNGLSHLVAGGDHPRTPGIHLHNHHHLHNHLHQPQQKNNNNNNKNDQHDDDSNNTSSDTKIEEEVDEEVNKEVND